MQKYAIDCIKQTDAKKFLKNSHPFSGTGITVGDTQQNASTLLYWLNLVKRLKDNSGYN